MFGCLKNVIEIGIIVLAIIGFFAINGDDFVRNMWQKYHVKQHLTNLVQNIKNKTENNKEEYSHIKNAELLGYELSITEHNQSGQKFAIIKNKNAKNVTINEQDFYSSKIDEKLQSISKKLKKQHINIKDLKIIKNNNKPFSTPENIKYIQFETDIDGIPIDKIKGSLTVKKINDETVLIVSANTAEKYSQNITNEYLKNSIK